MISLTASKAVVQISGFTMIGAASAQSIALLLCLLLTRGSSVRFVVNGPVLTLTLKDPSQQRQQLQTPNPAPSAADLVELLEQQASAAKTGGKKQPNLPPVSIPWLDLSSLRPNLVWDVTSLAPPLPYWFPNLKQLKARVGYQYEAPAPQTAAGDSNSNNGGGGGGGLLRAAQLSNKLPSWVEGTAKFATWLGELIVQPSYEVKSQRTTILLEASRGASWALLRLGLANPSQIVPHLEAIRGSFAVNLPYASVSQVRFTPSLEVRDPSSHRGGRSPRGVGGGDGLGVGSAGDWACQIEAVTGGYGRTRAILNLEWEAPTLSVVHQLDGRNTIAPTINLYNARIVYQWNCLLGRSGLSSVRTRVDPTSAIDVTWTDQSEGGGGSWVTDIRLPLEATTLQKLAADVRIRRQFRF
jgi:hypothetical protein